MNELIMPVIITFSLTWLLARRWITLIVITEKMCNPGLFHAFVSVKTSQNEYLVRF